MNADSSKNNRPQQEEMLSPPCKKNRVQMKNKSILTLSNKPNTPPNSNRKQRSTTNDKLSNNTPASSKNGVQESKIDQQLRTFLKVVKAQKWICYEWFYSNIDRCIFLTETDFQSYLKRNFPELETKNLTRVQWNMIRKLLGKPRRISAAFFKEERVILERKRQIIRAAQQCNLTVGTKVTAWLHNSVNGLYMGNIGAVDTSNNTYQVIFQNNLGTRNVPDYEVFSEQKILNQEIIIHVPRYPMNVLRKIVLLSKIFKIKQLKISQLKKLNDELSLLNPNIPEDKEYEYAMVLIDLENLNKFITTFFKEIPDFYLQIAPESSVDKLLVSSCVRVKSYQEARSVVAKRNSSTLTERNKDVIDLITNLTAVMIQAKNLTESGIHGKEREDLLNECANRIKHKLSDDNKKVFENCVEIHLKKIK